MDAAYIHPHSTAIESALIPSGEMKVVVFPTLEQALIQEQSFHVFIVSNQIPISMLIDTVKMLRQHEQDFLNPLFLDKPLGPELVDVAPLFDGVLSRLDRVNETVRDIQTLCQQLTVRRHDWKSRVLYYLFTRPDKSLVPSKHYQWPEYYRYWLIEVFLPARQNYLMWLEDLVDLCVLQQESMVDSFFYCPHCLSAHLQFIELCPNCKSFHLRPAKFIHCFTCGAIAPQEEFLTNNRLVCPKCRTALRHIAEDYDYSLESGLCLDCNEYYMESNMKACCMGCDKKYQTDQIKKRYVYRLELTPQGRDYVHFDTIENSLTVFDKINYVNPSYFHSTVNWVINLQKRYPEECFSILGIKLDVLAIQASKTHSMYEIAQAIRSIVRTTDLLTRLSERFIWILLPKTDEKGAERVVERIVQGMPEQASNEQAVATFINYTVSSQSEHVEDSAVLIASLMEELDGSV